MAKSLPFMSLSRSRRTALAGISVLSLVAAIGCQPENSPLREFDEFVHLNAVRVELNEGDTAQLQLYSRNQLNAHPRLLDSGSEVRWSSSASAIASVHNGTISSLQPGVTRVTATSLRGGSASVEVEVFALDGEPAVVPDPADGEGDLSRPATVSPALIDFSGWTGRWEGRVWNDPVALEVAGTPESATVDVHWYGVVAELTGSMSGGVLIVTGLSPGYGEVRLDIEISSDGTLVAAPNSQPNSYPGRITAQRIAGSAPPQPEPTPEPTAEPTPEPNPEPSPEPTPEPESEGVPAWAGRWEGRVWSDPVTLEIGGTSQNTTADVHWYGTVAKLSGSFSGDVLTVTGNSPGYGAVRLDIVFSSNGTLVAEPNRQPNSYPGRITAEKVAESPPDEGGTSEGPSSEGPTEGSTGGSTGGSPEYQPVGGLLPAFPGAEGWGAEAFNECRALPIEVLAVTNTNTSGSGSLSAAVTSARSDRFTFIIFRTGGRINAPSSGGIHLGASCVYIAGQTAPGGGIAIDGRDREGLWIRGPGGNISDIAIRYLRIRGASISINVSKGNRILLDHLSLSWASNVILAIMRYPWGWSDPISNVSVQNTIISEVLGDHPTAFVLGTGSDFKEEEAIGMGNISIHRNLLASNSHRNPMTAADNAVIANNVIYNWRTAAGMMNRRGTVDWTNNFGKSGPMSKVAAPFLVNPYCNELGGDFSIYAAGNVGPATSNGDADNWTDPTRQVACMRNSGEYPGQPVPPEWRRNTPLSSAGTAFPLTLRTAQNAYNAVVDNVGANARVTCDGSWVSAIDPVDARVISETRSGSGITSPPRSAGPWPTYDPGTPCADTDGDGLPDAWEERYFGSKTGARPDAIGRDGYLLIEHYVNGTNPH